MSGAPPLGLFANPATGTRQSARLNPEAAAAAKEGLGITGSDPAVDSAIDDLVSMLRDTSLGGSRRKRRGGGKFSDAVGALFSGVKSRVTAAGSSLDSAAATVVENIGTISAVVGGTGATIAVLNHPTVIGNIAELAAKVFETGTNETITSRWGDWWAALQQIASAVGSVGSTVASQTVQGPVVPVAIAVAITLIRARRTGRSFAQVLRDDASVLTSVASRAATGQMQAFSEGYRSGSVQLGPSQLAAIARAIKITPGEGAAAMSSAASTGAPAMSSPGAVVPGSRNVGRIPTIARNLGTSSSSSDSAPLIPSSSSSSASAAAAAAAAAAPGVGEKRRKSDEEEGEGQESKKKKGGKSRKPRRTSRKTRRMTRRAKKITALKFVY